MEAERKHLETDEQSSTTSQSLQDKTCVVTGASRRIGRAIALERTPHGSTANCVAPGETRTDMVEGVREDIQDRTCEQISLDQFASPQEVASTVGLLAKDDASYITAEAINGNDAMHG